MRPSVRRGGLDRYRAGYTSLAGPGSTRTGRCASLERLLVVTNIGASRGGGLAALVVASVVLACTAARPDAAGPVTANAAPEERRDAAPAGAPATDLRVTLVRAARHEHVQRVEFVLDAAAAPASEVDGVREVLAQIDRLDLARVPTQHLPCGGDGRVLELTLRRGAETRSLHVDEACVYDLCDADQRCDSGYASEWLGERGHSWQSMHTLVQIADAVEARQAERQRRP
jgi:hypothetical protein